MAARCSKRDFGRIDVLIGHLVVANQRQNLVSHGSLAHIWMRHVADSAQLLDYVPRETSPWVDLGTGAGFPGLVLALMQPTRSFILIESRKLRVAWLQEMLVKLNVRNCVVLAGDVQRVEPVAADVISARAFAPLNRLVAQSARFSTAATRWVLPKGRSASQELAALPPNLRQMFHVEQSVTDQAAGVVVGTGKVDFVW